MAEESSLGGPSFRSCSGLIEDSEEEDDDDDNDSGFDDEDDRTMCSFLHDKVLCCKPMLVLCGPLPPLAHHPQKVTCEILAQPELLLLKTMLA